MIKTHSVDLNVEDVDKDSETETDPEQRFKQNIITENIRRTPH